MSLLLSQNPGMSGARLMNPVHPLVAFPIWSRFLASLVFNLPVTNDSRDQLWMDYSKPWSGDLTLIKVLKSSQVFCSLLPDNRKCEISYSGNIVSFSLAPSDHLFSFSGCVFHEMQRGCHRWALAILPKKGTWTFKKIVAVHEFVWHVDI